MTRLAPLAVLGVLAGAVAAAAPAPWRGAAAPDAAAFPTGAVLGSYRLQIRGDGWTSHRATGGGGAPSVRQQRVAGGGTLVVRARDAGVNDGMVTAEIVLDPGVAQSVLGSATPGKPAFRGTAAVQGSSVSVMDDGTRQSATAGLWVNAVNLRFQAGGRRVSGTWMAAFPAAEAGLETQGFAAGVTVTLTGRRASRESPR